MYGCFVQALTGSDTNGTQRCGPIGLLTVLFLKAGNAAHVLATCQHQPENVDFRRNEMSFFARRHAESMQHDCPPLVGLKPVKS